MNNKLTEDQVIAIRKEHVVGGTTYAALSEKYGVGRCQIYNIVSDKAWRSLPVVGKRSPAELTAYAAFLLSEKNRHLDDVKMIDRKLEILKRKGYEATEEGPWISEEALEAL